MHLRRLEDMAGERTEDLRRQREWLEITLGSIGDVIIATDVAGLITSLNPVAVELTGWQFKKARGSPSMTFSGS